MHEPPPRGAPYALTAIFFGLVTALARVTPIFDPDYFWHLATGRLVLARAEVPRVDPFSHTFAGRPWRFVDWAADALMALLQRAGGDALVVVTFALAGGAAVALSLAQARRLARLTHPASLAVAGVALAACVTFRNTPRPQTLTFLCAWGLLAALDAARRDPRWLLAAPALIALWQNVHSSATVGAVIVAASALGARFDRASAPSGRAWAAATAASTLALFACAHPIDRLAAGFVHLFDPRVVALFDEWAPLWKLPSFYPAAHAFAVLVGLAALCALDPARARALPTARWVAALACVVLAARTIRLIPIAAVALAPAAALGVDILRGRTRGALRVLALCGLAALGAWALARMHRPWGTGVSPQSFPVGAARWARRHPPRGHLLNDFHHGGYLLDALGGEAPVFIDGRSMAVYGVEFTWRVMTARDPELLALVRQYDVGWALLPTSARVGLFQSLPGWSLVYFDDDAFVAVRDDLNPDLARAAGYRELHPAAWGADLDRLARDPRALAAAEAEAARALRDAPRSAIPRVMAAVVTMARGDLRGADATLQATLRDHPTSLPALRAAMACCARAHDRGCACRRAGRVLQRAPGNASARAVRRAFQCNP